MALWSTQELQTIGYCRLFSREAGPHPVEVLRDVSCNSQERGDQRECVRHAQGAPTVKPGEVQFEVQCSPHGAWDKDKEPAVMATE